MNEKTHWLQNPNKNYLGHWDLPESGEMVLTIKSAQWEEVKNPIVNTKEAKRVVRFVENFKPMICNQTNAQSIVDATGVRFMEDSGGKTICLYVARITDKRSKEEIDCIRIKGKKSVGLDEVKAMFKEKEILIPPSELEQVLYVIDQKDKSKYERVHNYLSKLKV